MLSLFYQILSLETRKFLCYYGFDEIF